MSQQNPDAIRSDIERTRERLGYDVDAVADKVTPSHVAHRQTEKIKGAVSDMKDRVMGSADDAASSARSAGQSAADAADRTQHRVAAKTKGNPLAAGLIAFGAGLLVASLFPPSEKEQELAQRLQEKAEPLTQELSAAASHVASELKEPARDALESVQESAAAGAENVKDEAQYQGTSVQGRVQEAQRNVREG